MNAARLAFVLLALSASAARAQDINLKSTYGSTTLKAGFEPDPFVKQLVAGGEVFTNAGGVNAHVANAPDFQLFYTAGKYALTVHVESAADTTLLINLPDGTWVANDDGPNNGLNPLLRFGNPQSGRYDIWVGTYGKDNAQATLKITEMEVSPKTVAAATGARAEVIAEWDRAFALAGAGKEREAIAVYQALLPKANRVLGADSADTATIIGNLAILYRNQARYREAVPLYRRSLEIREAKLGKDHLDTAKALNNLAHVYEDMGRYELAEPMFRRALEVREAKLGKDHPDVASSLLSLGFLYGRMGFSRQAEPLVRRSLEIREAKLGKDHPDTGASLDGLAGIYRQLGKLADAEPLARRSLEIMEAKYGKDDPQTDASLYNLALLLNAMGKYKDAQPLYRRSLAICEKRLGRDHPSTAVSLSGLAGLYKNMGRYKDAEPLERRVVAINEAKLGRDHPDTSRALNELARLYEVLGRSSEAAEAADRARHSVTRHVARVLPVLSEAEQQAFLSTTRYGYYTALSLALAERQDPSIALMSAAWLINGQGLSQTTLAQQQLLARDAADPSIRSLVEQLKQARAGLAALLQRDPREGQEADYRRQQAELQEREQDLARRLARATGRQNRPDPWISLEEVRGTLDKGSVLVDIARVPMYNFQTRRIAPPRYAAWIIPPEGQGAVRLIDLGGAALIDAAVKEARQALLDSAGKLRDQSEAEAVAQARQPLEALAAKVLHPLLDSVKGYKELVLCPDGALWLAPWTALPMPDGKYVLEEYLLRFVVSGRDLVMTSDLPTEKGATQLFADPDFDLAPGEATRKGRSLLREQGLSVVSNLAGMRLPAAIGDWKVSFEFRPDGGLVVYDEDSGGTQTGQGTWQQKGAEVVMLTRRARFEGTIDGASLAGSRLLRKDDGTTAKDFWHANLGDTGTELRSAGAASHTLPPVRHLPGTAAEAAALRSKLKDLVGADPKVNTGAEASETLLKAIKRPRVLVLSTHGYFLPEQELEQREEEASGKRSAVLKDKLGQKVENPLLRCGLLLAGCNKRAEAQRGEDDGVLTGLEIVGLDLRGTELVVLSACETGIGDVRQGEGVAGLRQAFQLAGAQGVLATLWQVSDRETALLMDEFFANLVRGQSRSAALRSAQLSRIAARRDRYGEAHPFFWAAFSFTGRN